MTRITIDQELVEFLKQEDVLERFIENTKEYYDKKEVEDKLHIFEIADGFLWMNTREKGEGHDYWEEIDTKWCEYKEQNGIE